MIDGLKPDVRVPLLTPVYTRCTSPLWAILYDIMDSSFTHTPTTPYFTVCFQVHYSRATVIFSAYRSMCESCRFLVGPKQTEAKQGKTELLVPNAGHRPRTPIEAIQVSSERIMPVSSARNIEVVFDQEITLVEQVTTICKTCFLHLTNIAKIRDSLSQKDTEILVHASIFSKLYSCNSLLYGLLQSRINRLKLSTTVLVLHAL